jgi:hypothetical protein
MEEIVEIGRAQDVILGPKDPGGADGASGDFRFTTANLEDDE